MAITLTPSLGLPQWGQGADSPSRASFDALLATIDAYTVVDDRTNPAALPTGGVNGQSLSDGRYAHVVNGTYRQLFRRAQGAWAQVGGNTWDQTTYSRAATGLDAATAARVVSHPSLTTAGLTENWDGSSVRGGRQAVGDLNAAQPGAIHVGDTATAVALATRGRVWVKAAAAGERAVVATAGVASAGNLFTAVDSTGAEPWAIDGSGRMRSQAATAFGGAALTAGVPFASAPGGADSTAADLYAATGKFASRWWRALGDTTPVASISDTAIVLGRNPWTGGSVSILSPLTVSTTLAVTGAATLQAGLTVTGGTSAFGATTVGGTLGVTGATTLAGLNAGTSGLGATTASSLAVTGAATVGTTLGVSGATTLAALTASGATSLGSTLAVTGATTLAALTANGLALLKASAQVTGTLSATSTITASADVVVGTLLKLPVTQPAGSSAGQVRVAADYTIEVYDGSAWRGKFGSDTAANASGRKHYWDDQGAVLAGSDVYTQVTGFDDALSPQGTVATLTSGSLYLNKAGMWAINCSFFCDSVKDGVNRVQFRWASGGFPGRSFMTDVRTRQWNGSNGQSGNGEATITWVGWVSSAAAAQAIQVWVAQRTSDGSNGSCIFTLSAEYLGR